MDTPEVACLNFHLLHHSLRGFSASNQQPSQSYSGSPSITRCDPPPDHPAGYLPGQGRAEPGEKYQKQRGYSIGRWRSLGARGRTCQPARTEGEGRLHSCENHREVPQDAPRASFGDLDLQNQSARECDVCFLKHLTLLITQQLLIQANHQIFKKDLNSLLYLVEHSFKNIYAITGSCWFNRTREQNR